MSLRLTFQFTDTGSLSFTTRDVALYKGYTIPGYHSSTCAGKIISVRPFMSNTGKCRLSVIPPIMKYITISICHLINYF